jgi:hypothetical protein
VTALEHSVTSLENEVDAHVAGLQDQITELGKQIADLHQLFVAKPLPPYKGKAPLFGGTVISYPEG